MWESKWEYREKRRDNGKSNNNKLNSGRGCDLNTLDNLDNDDNSEYKEIVS